MISSSFQSRYLTVAAALAALAVASVSAALAVPIERRGQLPGAPDVLPCVVRVDFTSLASGPDYDTWNAVRAYIADSKEIYSAAAWTWGREGEFSLCLELDPVESAAKVMTELAAVIPAIPAGKGGPTRVIRPTLAPK
jgi:hypothetical protein